MNDAELIAGLRRHEPTAVRYLMDVILPSIWRSVYVQSHSDRMLAEDILSETVLALLTTIGANEDFIENPGGWLRGVARNKLNDHFRAVARVQHLIEKVARDAPVETTALDPARRQELEERRSEVRAAFDRLPENLRQILEWKYLDNHSVRIIAERLQLSEKAAESLLFRARRLFRELLHPESNGTSGSSADLPLDVPKTSSTGSLIE